MNKKKKLRYAILKSLEMKENQITEKDFKEVTITEFDEQVRFLVREKYITGVAYGDGRYILQLKMPTVTEKGEEYLEENSPINRSYNTLKELREWFRL